MALSAGDLGESLWRRAATANRDELPFFSLLFSSGSREAGAGERRRRELRAAMAGPSNRDEALLFFHSLMGSEQATMSSIKTHCI